MPWVETLLLRQILADLQRRQMPTQALALVAKLPHEPLEATSALRRASVLRWVRSARPPQRW
jgi:hypothetical protein